MSVDGSVVAVGMVSARRCETSAKDLIRFSAFGVSQPGEGESVEQHGDEAGKSGWPSGDDGARAFEPRRG